MKNPRHTLLMNFRKTSVKFSYMVACKWIVWFQIELSFFCTWLRQKISFFINGTCLSFSGLKTIRIDAWVSIFASCGNKLFFFWNLWLSIIAEATFMYILTIYYLSDTSDNHINLQLILVFKRGLHVVIRQWVIKI